MEDVQSIIDWVDGVKVVLEIKGELSRKDYQAIEKLHPDFIQVDITANLEELHEDIPIIKVINPALLTESELLNLLESNIEPAVGFIVDLASYSWDDLERGDPISFSFLKKIISGYSCLLKLNYSSKSINLVIDSLEVDGICLEGGMEEKVGYKDFATLDELLEILTLD